MARLGVLVVALLVSSSAFAERRRGKDEPPVQFEFGVNTRHFTSTADDQTAFRGEMDPSTDTQTALTADLRFTRWMPWNMFIGIEGEIGKLMSDSGSNLAGTYGVVGARFDIGSVILSAELANGWRTVRFQHGDDEHGKWIVEPRARAQLWAGSRVTVGAALGATIGAREVWMAGMYIGVHSLVDGRKQP